MEVLLDNSSDLNLLSRETWNNLVHQLPQLKSRLQLGPVQQFIHADMSWSSASDQLGHVDLQVRVPVKAREEITLQFLIVDCNIHHVVIWTSSTAESRNTACLQRYQWSTAVVIQQLCTWISFSI